jgi:hypothetical protein
VSSASDAAIKSRWRRLLVPGACRTLLLLLLAATAVVAIDRRASSSISSSVDEF